jgi:hypothetical protein
MKRVAKELSKSALCSSGLLEDKCDEAGTEPPDDYKFFCGNSNDTRHLDTGVFLYGNHIRKYEGKE